MFYPKTTIVMVLLAGILGYRALPPPVADAWVLDPSARVLAHANRIVQHARWTWIEYRADGGDACALVATGLARLEPPVPSLFPGRFIRRHMDHGPDAASHAVPAWITGIEREPAAGLERIRRGQATCQDVRLPDWIRAAD